MKPGRGRGLRSCEQGELRFDLKGCLCSVEDIRVETKQGRGVAKKG